MSFHLLRTTGQESITISEESLDLLIDHLSDVPAHRIKQMQRNQTRRELEALVSAIETYGTSRSLVAFANYTSILSSVIPSLPAVESLTTDLSVKDSSEIITDIRTFDLRDTTAEEGILSSIVEHTLKSVAATFVVRIIELIGHLGIDKYRAWKDDRDNRRAEVIPFKMLTDLLRATDVFPRVANELTSLTLPKTEEEYIAFVLKVDSISSPLTALGIHITNSDIRTISFPIAVKENIESLGYRENSLGVIGSLIEHAKVSSSAVKSINFNSMDQQFRDATKAERDYVHKGYGLIEDVITTGAVRVVKILRLAKRTINDIKRYYKEG